MRLLPFVTLLTVAGSASLLASCSDSTTAATAENVLTHNDFESLEGWVPATPSLTTAKAHSGRYALKVDNGVEYALGYITPLANASPTRLKKLDVSAWTLVTAKGAEAKLVVEVRNPANAAQSVFWDAIDLSKEAKDLNKWVEVKKTFTLPETVEPTHELRIYMWRGGSAVPVFLDDVVVARGE